jgi:hypothetical protein
LHTTGEEPDPLVDARGLRANALVYSGAAMFVLLARLLSASNDSDRGQAMKHGASKTRFN